MYTRSTRGTQNANAFVVYSFIYCRIYWVIQIHNLCNGLKFHCLSLDICVWWSFPLRNIWRKTAGKFYKEINYSILGNEVLSELIISDILYLKDIQNKKFHQRTYISYPLLSRVTSPYSPYPNDSKECFINMTPFLRVGSDVGLLDCNKYSLASVMK